MIVEKKEEKKKKKTVEQSEISASQHSPFFQQYLCKMSPVKDANEQTQSRNRGTGQASNQTRPDDRPIPTTELKRIPPNPVLRYCI